MKVDEARGAGREIVTFSNGAEKDTGTKTTVLRFFNGDVKKIMPDRRVVCITRPPAVPKNRTQPVRTFPPGLRHEGWVTGQGTGSLSIDHPSFYPGSGLRFAWPGENHRRPLLAVKSRSAS